MLIVPRSSQLYLRGRQRQAVRTNLRRARDAGLTCAYIARFAEREAVVNLFAAGRLDSWERKLLIGRPESSWWAVFDAKGQPIGLAMASIDSEVALIWSLMCRGQSGRWLLHTEIVSEMAKRGVTYLLVATKPAPFLQPGTQYFQRLLGYQVAHLELR